MPSFKIIGLLVLDSGEEDFLKVSTIYGHDSHLGHVTLTVPMEAIDEIGFQMKTIENCHIHVYKTTPWGHLLHVFLIK